ncbi:hypothetical protein PLEIONE_44 [Mycobacterium phage Pleione]|uniref:Uncharacterized protein n=15 Tax=Bixzunavirus TaxID=680114 RepID=B5LK31_9CAUD|nr:hypothetical protein SCOTTMCG_40 [Mycobacterium phage ScottMcG]YP_002224296.1 gp42 [Mycobacterium phage Spud]YP_002224738.1 gp40 [Mycobacterium phage Rizal]YP_008060841.1 hypothetical protein M181_gp044 [Mycobacterium phage Gizmo]YP_009017818.1 hypothetical protein PLEIONE_44 [Mycobacterium phage Pleione]YP_010058365.1 hypothetical protein KHO64_gp041 [Mycobacterium phage Quasimodo]YP_656053.1 gp40 [Mycobacterium phage Catera]AER25410.1 hypothetical protein WALLY_40 [Mycobacterium phage W
MPNQFLRNRIAVGGPGQLIGAIDVSTADANKMVFRAETCLFWGLGRSLVVERYDTWDEAISGHSRWYNNPARCVECILAYIAERDRTYEECDNVQ